MDSPTSSSVMDASSAQPLEALNVFMRILREYLLSSPDFTIQWSSIAAPSDECSSILKDVHKAWTACKSDCNLTDILDSKEEWFESKHGAGETVTLTSKALSQHLYVEVQKFLQAKPDRHFPLCRLVNLQEDGCQSIATAWKAYQKKFTEKPKLVELLNQSGLFEIISNFDEPGAKTVYLAVDRRNERLREFRNVLKDFFHQSINQNLEDKTVLLSQIVAKDAECENEAVAWAWQAVKAKHKVKLFEALSELPDVFDLVKVGEKKLDAVRLGIMELEGILCMAVVELLETEPERSIAKSSLFSNKMITNHKILNMKKLLQKRGRNCWEILRNRLDLFVFEDEHIGLRKLELDNAQEGTGDAQEPSCEEQHTEAKMDVENNETRDSEEDGSKKQGFLGTDDIDEEDLGPAVACAADVEEHGLSLAVENTTAAPQVTIGGSSPGPHDLTPAVRSKHAASLAESLTSFGAPPGLSLALGACSDLPSHGMFEGAAGSTETKPAVEYTSKVLKKVLRKCKELEMELLVTKYENQRLKNENHCLHVSLEQQKAKHSRDQQLHDRFVLDAKQLCRGGVDLASYISQPRKNHTAVDSTGSSADMDLESFPELHERWGDLHSRKGCSIVDPCAKICEPYAPSEDVMLNPERALAQVLPQIWDVDDDCLARMEARIALESNADIHNNETFVMCDDVQSEHTDWSRKVQPKTDLVKVQLKLQDMLSEMSKTQFKTLADAIQHLLQSDLPALCEAKICREVALISGQECSSKLEMMKVLATANKMANLAKHGGNI